MNNSGFIQSPVRLSSVHRRKTKYSRMILRRQREIRTARCPAVVAVKEGKRSRKGADSAATKKNKSGLAPVTRQN